jgi:hypothetical protein
MQSFRKLIAKLRSRNQGPVAASANGNNIKTAPPQSAPKGVNEQQVMAAGTAPTLTITLRNASNSSQVYVYVSGLALDSDNRHMFLQSDGRTIYFPSSPASVGSPLAADVAIPLGAPGSTKDIAIPRIAGGRVWFSIGAKLVFALNPGPGIVEVRANLVFSDNNC